MPDFTIYAYEFEVTLDSDAPATDRGGTFVISWIDRIVPGRAGPQGEELHLLEAGDLLIAPDEQGMRIAYRVVRVRVFASSLGVRRDQLSWWDSARECQEECRRIHRDLHGER